MSSSDRFIIVIYTYFEVEGRPCLRFVCCLSRGPIAASGEFLLEVPRCTYGWVNAPVLKSYL